MLGWQTDTCGSQEGLSGQGWQGSLEDWWESSGSSGAAASSFTPRPTTLKRALESFPPPPAPKRRPPSWEPQGWSWHAGPSTPRQPAWSGYWSIGQRDKDDIEQWRQCSRVGRNVAGTPIVPCKTPFEGPLANRAYEQGFIEDADWFGKEDLIKVCEEQGTPVGLVIDLVNTEKYYTGFSAEAGGLEYHKVRIPGRTVPERALLEEIFDRIDEFASRRPGEYVAIHCTHGVNRTGFVVAAYLMTRTDMPQHRKAVAAFEKARGCKIDKEYLIEALQWLEEGKY